MTTTHHERVHESGSPRKRARRDAGVLFRFALLTVVAVALFGAGGETYAAPLKFIYPVKGAGVSDITQNTISPRMMGWHVNNDFSSYCGNCGGEVGLHPGEDLNLDCGAGKSDCDLGEPVYAVADGKVIKAWDLGSGLLHGVIIEHDTGVDEPVSSYILPGTSTSQNPTRTFYSAYLHLKDISVKDNDVVTMGTQIGTIGSANGPHLHFEMRAVGKTSFPKYQSTRQQLTDWGLLVPSLFLAAHTPPCEISGSSVTVVEPETSCWARLGPSSTWTRVESADGVSYYTYTVDASHPESYAKWHLSFAQAGRYTVEVFIPDVAGLSKKAKYKLWLGASLQTIEVDQEANAGTFVTLGQFDFPAGAGPALRLDDNTGEAYTGDAQSRKIVFGQVRFTPDLDVGACSTPPCGPAENPAVDTGSGGTGNLEGAAGCSFSSGDGGVPAGLAAFAVILGLAVLRRRRPLRRGVLAVALLALAGCSEPASSGTDDLGYVEIDGKKMNLVPADEQLWDGLNEADWDPDPVFGQELPTSVDHAPFQTPVRQQGESLTCVDYATVAGMESFAYFQPMEGDLSEAQLSALHEQKTLQATMQAAASSKLTTEAAWPAGALAGAPGWQGHAHYGILTWKAIADPTSIDGLRARLAEGEKINVIVSLSHVGVAWKLNGKIEPVNAPAGSWAHAILLVGYKKMLDGNNQQKWFFHFKNSWGTSWGEAGYGWISEDYITKHALQGAVVREVTQTPEGDPCANVVCGKCLACSAGICSADPAQDGDSCGGGEVCSNGGCIQPDPCANVQCGACLACSGGVCTADPSQNGSSCGSGMVCEDGACIPGSCVPSCTNKCGGAWNGCDGVCNGACPLGTGCANQVCVPCGDSGEPCCNGSCNGGLSCNGGTCGCVPSCNGACAGAPDGCGGTCPGPSVVWTAKAPLSSPDEVIISAAFNGEMHVFGWTYYLRHRVFNPGNNTWIMKNDMPYSAQEGAAVSVGGSLFAFGQGLFGGDHAMKWNAASDSWTVLAANPWPRRYAAAGVIDGKVYLAGGFAGNDDKVNVYDPAANTWADLPALPVLAGGVNTGVSHGGRLYVFGVVGGGYNPVQGQRFDPATSTWSALAPLAESRYGSRAVVIGSKVWLMGGSKNGTVMDSIYLYDIPSDTWCPGPALPEPRFLFATEQIGGKIYLVGGYGADSLTSAKVWEGTIQ